MKSVFNFDEMVQRAADNIETLTINKDYKSEKTKTLMH